MYTYVFSNLLASFLVILAWEGKSILFQNLWQRRPECCLAICSAHEMISRPRRRSRAAAENAENGNGDDSLL